MPPERRRLIGLVAVLVVALGVAANQFLSSPSPATQATRGVRRAGRNAAQGGPTSVTTPDVHLQALRSERPAPATAAPRDLFRFKPKAPPPKPPAPVRPVETPAAVPAGPPPPPALAPIAMRFIGLVEEPERAQKIAILSDGRGIYQGREGDIIEGRYRIVRIGLESVEMTYLDGRGRQTIRLSGS